MLKVFILYIYDVYVCIRIRTEYFYEMFLTGTMNDDYIMSQNRHQCEFDYLIGQTVVFTLALCDRFLTLFLFSTWEKNIRLLSHLCMIAGNRILLQQPLI